MLIPSALSKKYTVMIWLKSKHGWLIGETVTFEGKKAVSITRKGVNLQDIEDKIKYSDEIYYGQGV